MKSKKVCLLCSGRKIVVDRMKRKLTCPVCSGSGFFPENLEYDRKRGKALRKDHRKLSMKDAVEKAGISQMELALQYEGYFGIPMKDPAFLPEEKASPEALAVAGAAIAASQQMVDKVC